MSILDCTGDFKCPGNLVCFGANEPWSPIENGTFCDCMHDEGWALRQPTDQTCLAFTSQAYYFISVDVLFAVVSAAALLHAWATVWCYARGAKLNVEQRLTLLYTCLALGSLIVWRVVHLAAISTPESGVIDVSGVKKPETHHLQNVLIIVFCGISMFAYLNVSVVWMDVLSRTSLMFKDTSCFRGFSYKNGVHGVQACAFLLAIIAAAIGSVVLATISFVVPFVLALVMYTRGRFVFSKLLRDSFADEKVRPTGQRRVDYKEVAARVDSTSIIVILSLFGILLGLIVFAVLYDPRNNTVPGGVSIVYVMRDLAIVCALIGLWGILRYILYFVKIAPQSKSPSKLAADHIPDGEEEQSSVQISL